MVTTSSINRDIAPCGPLTVSTRRQNMSPQHSGLYTFRRETSKLGLLSDPEYGGSILLRNVCSLSVNYKALYARRRNYLPSFTWKQLTEWGHDGNRSDQGLLGPDGCQIGPSGFRGETPYGHSSRIRRKPLSRTILQGTAISPS
jgi:hypothetical protein